jgi:hypothetical protein
VIPVETFASASHCKFPKKKTFRRGVITTGIGGTVGIKKLCVGIVLVNKSFSYSYSPIPDKRTVGEMLTPKAPNRRNLPL